MADRSTEINAYRLSPRSIWILTLLVFAITRLSLIPLVLDFRLDELLYYDWALQVQGGSFPIGDNQYQYPPAAGLLFLGIEVAPGTFHQAFTLSVMLADAAILAILLVRVYRFGDSWRAPWAWIVGGAMVGGWLYERFDIFTALLAIVALLLASRPFVSGLLIGLGAMLKIWPGLLLFRFRRTQLLGALLGFFAGVVGVLGLAWWIADEPLSFLAGQSERGLQLEAVVAVPILLGDQLGLLAAESVDRYGSIELDAPYAGGIAWFGIAIAVVLLAVLVVQRFRGKLESIPGPDVVLSALLVFLAFNRVYSPQFFIWVAAISAVVLLDRRSRMFIPVSLAYISMLPYAQYLGFYNWALGAQTAEAVSLQVVRSLLFVASAGLAWWYVISQRPYRDMSSEKART